jgi:hypothetical protein
MCARGGSRRDTLRRVRRAMRETRHADVTEHVPPKGEERPVRVDTARFFR